MSSSPHRASFWLRELSAWLLAWRRARRFLLGVSLGWMLILAIGNLAPTDYSKPVPPSTIQAGACGPYGAVVSATETNSAGPERLYRIVCSGNGSSGPITLDWAQ